MDRGGLRRGSCAGERWDAATGRQTSRGVVGLLGGMVVVSLLAPVVWYSRPFLSNPESVESLPSALGGGGK